MIVMANYKSLSEIEFQDIEKKVHSKLGEMLKTHRVLREEVLDIVEQEATLLKYSIEDDELCAFVCRKSDQVYVYINTYIPKEKQVFAAAHELYHIWYDQERLNQTELLHSSTLENKTADTIELKANLFAALLLVPTDVLHNEINARSITKETIKMEDIIRLMALFYVPYKTIVRRLYEINIIDAKRLDHYLRIPDRDPESGVMLYRKRLQLSDLSQERTNEIFLKV